jgi:hypothetical protein
MEGLGQLKNTMPSSGIEPATFGLVAKKKRKPYVLNDISSVVISVPTVCYLSNDDESYVTVRLRHTLQNVSGAIRPLSSASKVHFPDPVTTGHDNITSTLWKLSKYGKGKVKLSLCLTN